MKLAVLICCFNRVRLTLQCLDALYRNPLPDGYSMQVYLVDDGSSDNTSSLIREHYPDITVIQGSGSLYWNGAMRVAWCAAIEDSADMYLWLNNDSVIYADALVRLISAYTSLERRGEHVGLVCGTMIDPQTDQPTYGGRMGTSRLNPIAFGKVMKIHATARRCRFVNGNLVLVPAKSVSKAGILSSAYTHGLGDFDYGLRLQQLSLSCWVAAGAFGSCAANPKIAEGENGKLRLRERVDEMSKPTQLPPPKEYKHYLKTHGGLIWPLLWVRTTLRQVLPALWVLARTRNHTYRSTTID